MGVTDNLVPLFGHILDLQLGAEISQLVMESVPNEKGLAAAQDEVAIAETRLAAAKPTLGICLGAQILARAIGGNVHPGPNALARQFHIEAGADGIEPWLVGRTGEIAQTPSITAAGLRADTIRHRSALRTAAVDVFHRRFAEIGFSQ